MKVKLMNYTPDGEKLIASAAKLCYSAVGVDAIQEGLTPEKTEKFLKMLVDLGHESPIEHVSFTFGVEGVSRTLTHQLVRHRLSSFSQQSQRYVEIEEFEYIIPPSIENNPTAKDVFIETMKQDTYAYNRIVEILENQKADEYLLEGLTTNTARAKANKEAIEDARYVFPNACETKIVFTMNARTLLNFFKLRTCNRAQWEIQALAIKMLELVKEVYPTLFKNAGPGCINAKCPEGNMTCGKIIEVREQFKNMQ